MRNNSGHVAESIRADIAAMDKFFVMDNERNSTTLKWEYYQDYCESELIRINHVMVGKRSIPKCGLFFNTTSDIYS